MEILLSSTPPISSDEVDGYFTVLHKWGKFVADIYLHPAIFGAVVIILTCVYIFRCVVLTYYGKQEAVEKGVYPKYKQYVFCHMLMEYLMAFLFTYLSIKLTGAYLDSYIINCITSEIVGLIFSILVDYLLLIPIEEKTHMFVNPIEKKIGLAKPIKNRLSKVENQNNITINVGKSNITKEEGNKVEIEPVEKTKEMEQVININETTEAMMKSIIDIQQTQSKQIEEMNKTIDAIGGTLMTNLRFELHDSMMECIKRGYATEDEYDRITEKMGNYTSLHGNHGIQELYDNQFKNITIK